MGHGRICCKDCYVNTRIIAPSGENVNLISSATRFFQDIVNSLHLLHL